MNKNSRQIHFVVVAVVAFVQITINSVDGVQYNTIQYNTTTVVVHPCFPND